jgi:hypothetical protein
MGKWAADDRVEFFQLIFPRKSKTIFVMLDIILIDPTATVPRQAQVPAVERQLAVLDR